MSEDVEPSIEAFSDVSGAVVVAFITTSLDPVVFAAVVGGASDICSSNTGSDSGTAADKITVNIKNSFNQ